MELVSLQEEEETSELTLSPCAPGEKRPCEDTTICKPGRGPPIRIEWAGALILTSQPSQP